MNSYYLPGRHGRKRRVNEGTNECNPLTALCVMCQYLHFIEKETDS